MELNEIFQYEDTQLYHKAAKLDQRFHQLHDLFVKFVGHFPPNAGWFPESVEFLPETENEPRLTVRWCGKELCFRFEMAAEAGRVRCLVSLPPEGDEGETEWEELGSLTFNGQGETNVTPPGPHTDPLVIHAKESAYAIVASFLVAAL